jgi:hypothetical protein
VVSVVAAAHVAVMVLSVDAAAVAVAAAATLTAMDDAGVVIAATVALAAVADAVRLAANRAFDLAVAAIASALSRTVVASTMAARFESMPAAGHSGAVIIMSEFAMVNDDATFV